MRILFLHGVSRMRRPYEAGLVEGQGNNRLAPNDQATRAEAVTLILRLLDKTEQQ